MPVLRCACPADLVVFKDLLFCPENSGLKWIFLFGKGLHRFHWKSLFFFESPLRWATLLISNPAVCGRCDSSIWHQLGCLKRLAFYSVWCSSRYCHLLLCIWSDTLQNTLLPEEARQNSVTEYAHLCISVC